ncbi:MAG: class I SAM-dependent methyltransferase [Flavonifractor plautii]
MARKKLGGAVELVQGDAERLPFADGRFEVLLCNDSFHHYPNPGAAAAEFARVLQPGGVLTAATARRRCCGGCCISLFLPLSGEGDVAASAAGRSWPPCWNPFHGVEFRPRWGRRSQPAGL